MTTLAIDPQKKATFARLFQEFANSDYFETPDGQWHLIAYEECRDQAKHNFAEISAAADRGEDVTDAVLLKLFPHTNTTNHREQKAWIHWAPAVTGDIKSWFEGAGWTKQEDWPSVAQETLRFVRRCYEHREELEVACNEFATSPYTTGLQTGMMTPILNALCPDDFVLINNKSRRILNDLDGKNYSQKLTDYPETNTTAWALLNTLSGDMNVSGLPDLSQADLFDCFTHWLVAIKDYYEGPADTGIITGTPAQTTPLAEPFATIFSDREEAEWAFDLLAATARRLANQPDGHVDLNDERFALTLRYSNSLLRLNFGNWMILDFSREQGAVKMALLTDQLADSSAYKYWEPFANSEREVRIYQVPFEVAKAEPGDLRVEFESTLDYISERFRNWRASPFRHAHRPQIFEALFDLSRRAALFANGLENKLSGTSSAPQIRYWRITLPENLAVTLPDGSKTTLDIWGICRREGMAAIGFDDDEENYQVQKFMDIQPGDKVVAFLRNKTIGGMGTVNAPCDEELFRQRPPDQDYWHGLFWFRIGVDWETVALHTETLPTDVANMFYGMTVVELTKDQYQVVIDAVQGAPPSEITEAIEPEPLPDTYDEQDFLSTTFLLPKTMEALRGMLLDKKQIILYGPPGTGKTFVAQELARLVTHHASPPPERVEMIQFHPAYTYEDFIEGIRPESRSTGDGHFAVHYPTRPGVFTSFCHTAEKNPAQPHVFIIDEINRGNIPRIFGELMLLLEYRQRTVPLPYSRQRFRIPGNVYLIGTMNTADRSIALVDFALRRRFHFFSFKADPGLLERWLEHHPVDVPYLLTLYRQFIEEQAIDDPDYAIGPSYFMKPGMTERQLKRIWQRSIEPYMDEYHLEQPQKARRWYWDSDKIHLIRERNE